MGRRRRPAQAAPLAAGRAVRSFAPVAARCAPGPLSVRMAICGRSTRQFVSWVIRDHLVNHGEGDARTQSGCGGFVGQQRGWVPDDPALAMATRGVPAIPCGVEFHACPALACTRLQGHSPVAGRHCQLGGTCVVELLERRPGFERTPDRVGVAQEDVHAAACSVPELGRSSVPIREV